MSDTYKVFGIGYSGQTEYTATVDTVDDAIDCVKNCVDVFKGVPIAFAVKVSLLTNHDEFGVRVTQEISLIDVKTHSKDEAE